MNKIKLSEICNINAGGTPARNKKEYWDNGNIPWCKISDFSGKYILNVEESITEEGLNNSSAKLFKKGTILYTIFATIGEVAILNIESTTNQAIAGIEIKNDDVELEYLYYFLKSLKYKMLNKSRGVAQNNINLSILRDTEIYLPDKNIQKEIAEKLDSIEKIICKKSEQLQELTNLVKSQFVEMFGNSNNKEKIKSLNNYFSRGKSPNYVESSKIGVINQACIYWDCFKMENIKYQDELRISSSFEKIIRKNDILITSTGTGTLGRCNVYSDEDNRYIADGHVSILRLKEEIINPTYFKYYFMQDKVQKKLYSECVNGSTNQIELSKDKFLNFDVSVPDIEKQNRFADFVKQIDKQKFVLYKTIEYLEIIMYNIT